MRTEGGWMCMRQEVTPYLQVGAAHAQWTPYTHAQKGVDRSACAKESVSACASVAGMPWSACAECHLKLME